MNNIKSDIKENYILDKYPGVLEILLMDRTTENNIIWGTDNYSYKGKGYDKKEKIQINLITKQKGQIIKPRINKSEIEQRKRSVEKAEVFTPAWICNKQNNVIDEGWFDTKESFNIENGEGWTSKERVEFGKKKWTEYIDLERMEITCGEAPYLASRYDVVSGKMIEPHDRIGLLDRKLRVISENTNSKVTWLKYAKLAYKRIYGYDFQGDNVLLARENLLLTFVDFYIEKFKEEPELKEVKSIANIISWNIWQMDGMKYISPLSCHEDQDMQLSFIPDLMKKDMCKGCKNGNIKDHNGHYCKIKDWRENKIIRFVDLIE